MKLATALFVLAFLLGAFGVYGLYTPAGRRQFDEMAGILPTAALALAGLLAVVAVVLFALRLRHP